MGAKNIKDLQIFLSLEKPEELQKSKKDDDLNLRNGQKVQEIFEQCSLIDFSIPLSEQLLSRLSTKIAECLMTMFLEYPNTDQFEHDRRLLIRIMKKSQILQKETDQKFWILYNHRKVANEDQSHAIVDVFDLLKQSLSNYN